MNKNLTKIKSPEECLTSSHLVEESATLKHLTEFLIHSYYFCFNLMMALTLHPFPVTFLGSVVFLCYNCQNINLT